MRHARQGPAPARMYASLLDEAVLPLLDPHHVSHSWTNTAKSANAASSSAIPPTGSPNLSPNCPNQVWSWDIANISNPSGSEAAIICPSFWTSSVASVVGWSVTHAESAALFRTWS